MPLKSGLTLKSSPNLCIRPNPKQGVRSGLWLWLCATLWQAAGWHQSWLFFCDDNWSHFILHRYIDKLLGLPPSNLGTYIGWNGAIIYTTKIAQRGGIRLSNSVIWPIQQSVILHFVILDNLKCDNLSYLHFINF
jgi:hypothetical protein